MSVVRPRVSLTDLERAPEDGRRYELYDGEAFVVPAPIPRHQLVAQAIVEKFVAYTAMHGGIALISPIDIVFSDYDVVQPLVPGVQAGPSPARRRHSSEAGHRGGGAVAKYGVDDTLQTNVPGVWALGECNGRGAFTHTTYNDYEIVAANLLHNDPRRVTDRIECYGLYIDPPLGRVGMTKQQVRESGRPALIATRPMPRVSRAVEKGETQGFMKILVDAQTHQILGAAILGVGGDEVVASILNVMYAKAPYTVIQRAVHIHPTVSELIPTMLADLQPLTS